MFTGDWPTLLVARLAGASPALGYGTRNYVCYSDKVYFTLQNWIHSYSMLTWLAQ